MHVERHVTILAEYAGKELIKRGNWGEINFENARSDIESVLYFANQLKDMPLESLDDGKAREMLQLIPQITSYLERIDDFSLEAGSPSDERDHICTQIKSLEERFLSLASPLLPYLAFRRGDLAEKNIELSNLLHSARQNLK